MTNHRAEMQSSQDRPSPLRGRPLDMRKEYKEFVDSWADYPDLMPPAKEYFAYLEARPLPSWLRKPQT